jgi:hypothetical protein
LNAMKRGLAGDNVGLSPQPAPGRQEMLYAGLDLSRQRLDVHLLDEEGETVDVTAVRPDADALRTLVSHVGRHGQEVTAAIESMTGARFVHDQLELAGWGRRVPGRHGRALPPRAPAACEVDVLHEPLPDLLASQTGSIQRPNMNMDAIGSWHVTTAVSVARDA